jgi:hypothetical protein
MALSTFPDTGVQVSDELAKDQLHIRRSPSNTSDAEKAGYGHSGGSKVGGRIAPVLPHLRGYNFESDASSDILGKQIELEEGNALKYRTCSWPKVCLSARLIASRNRGQSCSNTDSA